jgi:putative acetyltransferase
MAELKPETFVTSRTHRSLTLRSLRGTPEDVDAYLAFQPQIAAETTHTLQVVGSPPERDRMVAGFTAMLSDELALRVGFFEPATQSSPERLVGMLGFHPESSPPHPWTRHVGSFGMMILQEYWGEGLGRKLLEIIDTHARTKGFTRIEAKVRTANSRGVKLYERAGYAIEGTRREAAFIDGVFHDEYFIGKLLRPT